MQWMRRRQQYVLTTPRRGQMWILMNPLVVGVVVDAEQVQIFRAPAELGTDSACEHVPRLELRQPVALSGRRFFRVIRIDSDVNDRLCVADACAWINLAHGFDGSDRRAYELRLQLRTASLREGIQKTGVATTPRHKRDLIHGRDVERCASLLEHDFGSRAGEACESFDERRAPDV